jgi:1-acyl-sn-glycerol-3-phosphate acyltransferase
MLSKLWYWIGRTIVGYYALLFLQVDISEKISFPDGPVILAANHPSTIDPAVVTLLAPAQMRILILDTLFKVPLFGRSLRWSGHIPVVCGQGGAALDAAQESLRAGKTVVIFPEGVISPPGGGCHPPRTGMARLALTTGLPVIPVGIAVDPACIRRIHTRVDGRLETGTWYFHGPYALTIGEPMRFLGDAADREQVHQVTGQVMRQIDNLALESSLRIQACQSPNTLLVTGLRAAWSVVSRSLSVISGPNII